jgi:PAS domain S-box-containing protein
MPSITAILVLLVAGFCLFTAVYFLAVYFLMGRRYLDRLSFGLMALLGFGFAFSMLFQLKAPDLETYRLSLLWYLGIFIPNFLVFLWFTSYYTGYKAKPFLLSMAGLAALLWGVHWLMPFGLVTQGLREFGSQRLPWGETVTLVRAVPSVWVAPFYAYLFLGLGYALRAGWFLVRQSRWQAGKGFLFSVCVSFLAGFNNLLVDLGRLSGPYLSEAAVLAFIVFMTLSLAAEWRDQDLLYSQIFDAQNDALFVQDPETGDVLQFNEAAQRMFRAPRQELLGQGLLGLDDSGALLGAARQRPKSGKNIEVGARFLEGEVRRLDGTTFWVEVSFRAVQLMGRPRVITVVRDLTERRKLDSERLAIETRLSEAQRLESLGMMAAGVAHDFNNILMAIQGNVDLLERRAPSFPRSEETLAGIRLAVRSAADLCRQLLDYAGKGRVSLELVSLNQLVREVGSVVEAGVTSKARWEYELAETLPSVLADATQLRQVVLNLLTNAAEALGAEGGRVRVTLHVQPLDAPTAELLGGGDYVHLTVTDSGCGMSPETQSRVFEPFFTTKLAGRGLGLAAVQGILRAHGGTIQVTSQLGEGTTMTVLLPVASGQAVEPPPQATPEQFHGRTLVVEDEAAARKVTSGSDAA